MLTLPSLLASSVKTYPDKELIAFKKKSLTYSQFGAVSKALGGFFQNQGINKGSRIGIWLEKSIEECASIFGISESGGVFVILNSALIPEQVQYIAQDCQISALITTKDKYEMMRDKLKDIASLKIILLVDSDREYADSSHLIYKWEDAVQFSPKPMSAHFRILPSDLCSIIYTSGSTGRPKGVMLTHLNVTMSAYCSIAHLKNSSKDKVLCLLPMSFDFGLNQLTSMIGAGGTLILKKYIFPLDVIKTIKEQKITGVAGVPTIWIPILNSKEIESSNFDSIRYVANSGGRLPANYLLKLQDVFNSSEVYSMYGFTESFRATFLDPAQVRKRPESVGKAVPFSEIFVINEAGSLCQPGEEGELFQTGPLVSKGYWNKPDATATKIRQNPLVEMYQDAACFSGDYVKKDDDGYIYYVGRKDQQIKSSGFRMSPTEIEEKIYRCPYVQEVVAFGIEDDVLGQKVKAILTLKSDYSEKDVEKIRSFCQENMPNYMVPAIFEVIEKMPLTANGKINRPLLQNK